MPNLSRPEELRLIAEAKADQIPPEVSGYLSHIYRNKAHVIRGLIELVRSRLGDGDLSDKLLAASDTVDDLTRQLKPFMGEVR